MGVSHWSCGTTDISLNMVDMNAQVCSSFTTENQCQFQQKAIKGIQASLVSSGCDGLWVAPLWMVGPVWQLSSTSNVSIKQANLINMLKMMHGIMQASPRMILTSPFIWTSDLTVKIRWIHTCAQKAQTQLKLVLWMQAAQKRAAKKVTSRIQRLKQMMAANIFGL